MLGKINHKLKKNLSDKLLIILGCLSACLGLNGFLLPNHFLDGGVMGISLIFEYITQIPLSILIIIINLPFVIFGFKTVNKEFGLNSIFAITILALFIYFFQFKSITDDKLLISVFGGFFLGLGIGLTIRGGAVIDGTEILAIYLSKKFGTTIGDIILILNFIIFSIAAFIFSIEISLYAMLTYLAASKTVDFIIDGIEEYMGVTIISKHHSEIRVAITQNLHRGCTVYKGEGGFNPIDGTTRELNILFTVVTRLELNKLKREVNLIDPKAFSYTTNINDLKGGVIKKKSYKH